MFLLIGILFTAGCATSSLAPTHVPEQMNIPATPTLPDRTNATNAFLIPTRNLQENTSLFIDISPVPDHFQGDIITFNGITNLQVGENVTIVIFTTAIRGCTKMVPPCNPNTVNAVCCTGGGFRSPVAIVPSSGGINTWSYTINTSEYDFIPDLYEVRIVSEKTLGQDFFKILEKSESSGFWVAIDPIPDHALGNSITFHGTTNVPARENLTVWIGQQTYQTCPKHEKGACIDSVRACCDGIFRSVNVKKGNHGINTWSLEINTSSHDFRFGNYSISLGIPSMALTNTSVFTILEKPKPSSYWIIIDPITDAQSGDWIRIKGTTNLDPSEGIYIGADTEKCFTASSRFRYSKCCPSGLKTRIWKYTHIFNGSSQNNTWSFDIDTSGFPAGSYLVDVIAESEDAQGMSSFNLSGPVIDPACI